MEEVSNGDLKRTLDDILYSNGKISGKIDAFQRENTTLKKENQILLKKINQLERDLNYLLNKERMNNLLLFNVKPSEQDLSNLTKTIVELFKKNSVKISSEEIKDVKLLGKEKSDKRPILVSFVKAATKADIFRNIKSFKNNSIWISNDLSKRQREERDKLRMYKQVINSKCEKAFLLDNKLKYKETVYDIFTIQMLSDKFDFSEVNNNTLTKKTSNIKYNDIIEIKEIPKSNIEITVDINKNTENKKRPRDNSTEEDESKKEEASKKLKSSAKIEATNDRYFSQGSKVNSESKQNEIM